MNELATVRHAAADVDAYRASTEAANLCKEIVVATSSNIQGRRYVAVEGWQAIAVAHGCAASARDVERIDGGVRAIGEIRRMSDGQLIATAEGFVGEDETTWFGGKDKRGKVHEKRADYAIRAMAQTRAMSRAGRTAFAHVVVMMNAGLATTPAEEMVTIDGETGEIIDAAPREKVPGIHKIKERLSALRKEGDAATDLDAFNALVKAHKDDLKTIRDANHEWWTGDGEDFEGYAAWKERRKAELTPKAETLTFQLLVSNLNECESDHELQGFLTQHGDAVAMLDGEESRTFEALYDAKAAVLKAAQPDDMTRAYSQEELRQAARGGTTPLEAGLMGG
jgi:hypothetical protein